MSLGWVQGQSTGNAILTKDAIEDRSKALGLNVSKLLSLSTVALTAADPETQLIFGNLDQLPA